MKDKLLTVYGVDYKCTGERQTNLKATQPQGLKATQWSGQTYITEPPQRLYILQLHRI
jgi:hypothetical protein